MKRSEDGIQTHSTGDLVKALATGHGTRVALEVTDMPDELAKLLDKGLEDHFRDR
tara:strand:- start:1405 stop:1569 length:165 start_codon:yes stop_codon:yes gene_type:complete